VDQPGVVALLGSGETSTAGGLLFETVASRLQAPLTIRILETPAGFELNASRVAGRVGEFLAVRLQNSQPDVKLIPARRKGTSNSPDSAAVLQDLLDAQMIFMGPGSPTYATRQLAGSLAWDYVQALHRLGTAVVLASAATISFGQTVLPVYEIYKVGEDPHWKPGLDFFKPYGLSLVIIPHWNNADGGSELDTSRCFIGRERFEPLVSQLPAGTTIIGLDEHTGLIIDLAGQQCQVMGHSQVHIIRDGQERNFVSGDRLDIRLLGDFQPLKDPSIGIDPLTWQSVAAARQNLAISKRQPVAVPPEILEMVEQRQQARTHKQWGESDSLRDRMAALGWKVVDTPQGPRVERT
jgi:hypothetical protein